MEGVAELKTKAANNVKAVLEGKTPPYVVTQVR